MDSSVDEAIRAKALAEKHFVEKNFQAAKKYALKAQKLYPDLEGISQMVATFGVYAASEVKINGEPDFYSILGVDPFIDKSKLKRQSKKLALLLHPDKNRTVGADGAFQLVSEAWTLLSDSSKRNTYDQRRNWYMGNSAVAGGYEDCYKIPSHARPPTFWTVCTSCHVQYEYLRKYVNKRLSCKNCRGVFVAVETGMSPYTNYSHVPENGFGGHGYGSYIRPTAGYCASNSSSGHHNGSRSEYVSNTSFQRNLSGNSLGVVEPSGLSVSSFTSHPSNGETNNRNVNGFHQAPKAKDNVSCNGLDGSNESSKPRRGRAAKKRRVEFACSSVHGEEETGSKNAAEPKAAKLPSSSDTPTRRWAAAPGIDGRQLLMEKARSEICRKIEEFKLASEAAAAEALKRTLSNDKPTELKRSASMTITVPDSDFHDFDEGRTEECFKPRQVWALYDEEDGMPRLYCQIREVISLNPFKIHISYLASKSDSEFGSASWDEAGFTKSCGSFRAFHSETVDQVNIFSHLLTQTKVGRGGCARIYPRSGEVWAIYRNWSLDWDTTTPQEIRHHYEMVEVLDDYSEDIGVWITPLVKLDGYKTVYQRAGDSKSVRCIPRREMLRFSHQVPACSLKVEGSNLPEGCWDLDPAATPDELLQRETDFQGNNIDPDIMTERSETRADRTIEPS